MRAKPAKAGRRKWLLTYDEMMRLSEAQVRRAKAHIPSLFSRAGRELHARVFDEMVTESVARNGLAYPVLAVYSLPHGPMAVSLYREAGNTQPIAEFPDRINAAYPVCMLYIELSTLRSFQGVLTKPAWEKAYRKWRAKPPE